MQQQGIQTQRALILFAHGARDPQWALPFQSLCAQLQTQLPGTPVQLAFLEFMTPALPEAVASLASQGARQVVIVPVFLAQGPYLKRDLPAMVEALRKAHPACTIDVTPAIGEQPEIIAALATGVARLFAA